MKCQPLLSPALSRSEPSERPLVLEVSGLTKVYRQPAENDNRFRKHRVLPLPRRNRRSPWTKWLRKIIFPENGSRSGNSRWRIYPSSQSHNNGTDFPVWLCLPATASFPLVECQAECRIRLSPEERAKTSQGASESSDRSGFVRRWSDSGLSCPAPSAFRRYGSTRRASESACPGAGSSLVRRTIQRIGCDHSTRNAKAFTQGCRDPRYFDFARHPRHR
jgi:hypothetical protein